MAKQVTFAPVNGSGTVKINGQTSFSSARGAASGTVTYNNYSSAIEGPQVDKDGSYYPLARHFLSFDISSLKKSDIVQSATLYIYGGGNSYTNSPYFCLCDSSASTSVGNSSFNDITLNSPTEYVTRVAAGSNKTLTFNSTGITYLRSVVSSQSTYVKFCFRLSLDVDNSAPSGFNSATDLIINQHVLTINYVPSVNRSAYLFG
jgi:hypothetical protein